MIKKVAYNLVYHGSPYEFDTFDLTKIGTGDGNKYGWGFYFTDNPDFGGKYSQGKIFYDGQEVTDVYIGLMIVELEKGTNPQKLIKEYQDWKPYVADFIKNFDKTKLDKKVGIMYECAVPDFKELLDWESAIKGQPIYDKLVRLANKYQININDNPYGSQFYIRLSDKANSDRNASIILMTEENIPGLYYGDNGICFVIWDVSRIEIIGHK